MTDPKKQYESLQQSLIEGDQESVLEEVERLIEADADPSTLIADGMMPGMMVVGDRFSKNEMFVPEVLMSARAMNAGVERLRPLIGADDEAPQETIVIGTVKGDLHDIGKNLVAMFLETNGFRVVDLGVDVSPEAFVRAAREEEAAIVACSALLTTTMPVMEDVVKRLEEEQMRSSVSVIVGGAPLSQAYADRIGADGFSKDAGGAVELCRRLLAARGAA